MKRSHPPDHIPRRSAWQQPASCEFCRTKKIRCDKNRPCSNCTSRELTCQYALPNGTTETIERRDETSSHPTRISTLEKDVTDIYGRLKKLEESLMLASSSLSTTNAITNQTQPSPERTLDDKNDLNLCEDIEAIAASSKSDPATRTQNRSGALTTGYLAQSQRQAPLNDRFEKNGSNSSGLLTLLPNIRIARLLFQHYVGAVDCLHRELHVPSTQALLETTYEQITSSLEVSREVLTFFLCIFASSSFHSCHAHSRQAPESVKDSSKWSGKWKKAAIDLVFEKEFLFSTSLISLQSVSIMMLFMWNSEGQSGKFHALKSIAYQKAIQMKLHRIDAENSARDRDFIEIELKRRIWWHIAASDWLVASVPGHQEGIYSVNPLHARVNYPANLDDESIMSETPPPEGLPDDQPTSMSFFIHRIKFAELCRQITDSLKIFERPAGSANYHLVHELSERLRSFEHSLPWFFHMDEDDLNKACVLAAHRPYIMRQKHILLFGLYSRITRLHRPFLSRGLRDPNFIESRTVCLQYAENILKLRSIVQPIDLYPYIHSHSMDQHIFGALLLLSIDSMREKDEDRARDRKKELVDVCTMLKDKQQLINVPESGIVRAIDRVTDILQKEDRTPPTRASAVVVHNNAQHVNETPPKDLQSQVMTGDVTGCPQDTVSPNLQELANWDDAELYKILSNPQGLDWDEIFDWKIF